VVIVSWNCNGALRTKLHLLEAFRADVFVIQECEDPANAKSDAYRAWASNYLWVGTNKNRGLGVFAHSGIQLKACWDIRDPTCNHTYVVKMLASIGLQSLYHHTRGEAQASEKEPTFYLYRKLDRDYHIDYAFIPERWLDASSLEVGHSSDWLAHSDHMPLRIQLPEAAGLADGT